MRTEQGARLESRWFVSLQNPRLWTAAGPPLWSTTPTPHLLK